ncbi:proton-conducting membrane transporter [Vallitalea pronyensis]|uniref:Proton-conducting membrane transporter n=1 Tax=Vallitalea pronyensis TaxID=1348613 RepID=A0A8J8MJ81_9FIRM|nr:proton-conducting transporter membrane subunit [Vallitalea pronyensis]QUI22680.1 proton-conducting membrane transporter [Vallitalea pronyensis]
MIPIDTFIFFPIIIASVTYLVRTRYNKFILLILQFILFIGSIIQFIYVKYHGTITLTLGDYPRGIGITLSVDLMTAVFVMLAVFLFTCMFLYNFKKNYMNHLFLFLFLILQGLINGIFMSTDLFDLYILIEVSTIVVSILIMFKKDSRSIYDGMLYLLINMVAMAFFLIGTGYIYKIFGSVDMDVIFGLMGKVEDPRTLILPYCLIITAVSLKSAVMPLFSWLPRAHGTYSSPSIISAILSSLYVKCGVYLYIRIQHTFSPIFDTSTIFLVMGFLTAVVGFLFALSQTDIKLILSYHTISQIGLIIFGLNLNNTYSYWGSIYHIINHAIFKSVLFLTAGIIIENYETRDIRQIRGVFRRMPFVSIFTFMAILGITGAPFFNGSISKYLIQKGSYVSLLDYALIFINLGTILSFVKYMSMFRGHNPGNSHRPPINQRIVIMTLGTFCLLGGILGKQFISLLFNINIHIPFEKYLIKSLLYIGSIVIGLVFYIFLYHRIKFFKPIREVNLSFNQICLSITLFFTGLLSLMLFMY